MVVASTWFSPGFEVLVWEGIPVRRLLVTVAILVVCVATFRAAEKASQDSPAAAKTRKKLKEKVTVDFKETRLEDVAADLKKQFDSKLSIKIDNIGGVSNNLPVTYSAKNKSLDLVLDEMFGKMQLGYVVVSAPKASDPRNRFDGWLNIKKGKQRGFEAGEEPDKDKPVKDKGQDGDDDDKPKDKKKKEKKTKDKPAKDDKPKDKGQDDDGDKTESVAASKLKLIQKLYQDGKKSKNRRLLRKAKLRFKELIDMFPKTKAADEARSLLKEMEK
jgi:hypothetical protein